MFVSYVMVVFSVLAAIDRILGNRFGIGKEFEKGFMLLGTMMLSMTGMIIISPFIADLLKPAFDGIYNLFGIDPSVIPATLFANDMGGAPLAMDVARNSEIGAFNAYVVSAMMGATISFTIPFALGIVKENIKELIVGMLCGIVTIPVGSLVSGIIFGIKIKGLLLSLLPLTLFAIVIAVGLLKAPDLCVKIFKYFGFFIKVLITLGLALGILKTLVDVEPIKGLESIESGAAVCVNASIVMSGAFPLMYIVSKVLNIPLTALSKKIKINKTSAVGFVSTLATNVTTFEMLNSMDSKGAMYNSAFAVSAAFTFAGHLAFTMANLPEYIPHMIVGKLVAGFTAILIAVPIYKRVFQNKTQ